MRTVGAHEGRDLHPIDDGIEARLCFGFGADGIDARIGPAAMCHLLDTLVDVFLHEIERLGAALPREVQTLWHGIYRDDAFRTQDERRANGHLPDGAAAPDRNRVALLDVTEIRSHVAGRKYVGEKKHLLVRKMRR